MAGFPKGCVGARYRVLGMKATGMKARNVHSTEVPSSRGLPRPKRAPSVASQPYDVLCHGSFHTYRPSPLLPCISSSHTHLPPPPRIISQPQPILQPQPKTLHKGRARRSLLDDDDDMARSIKHHPAPPGRDGYGHAGDAARMSFE